MAFTQKYDNIALPIGVSAATRRTSHDSEPSDSAQRPCSHPWNRCPSAAARCRASNTQVTSAELKPICMTIALFEYPVSVGVPSFPWRSISVFQALLLLRSGGPCFPSHIVYSGYI